MTEETSKVYRVSLKSILGNILLFLGKLIFGLLAGSASLVSDAFHSLSDIISTVVVIVGIKLSSRSADDCHPYGHEKIETVIAFLMGLMLFGVGGGIGGEGIRRFADQNAVHPALAYLNIAAAVMAAVSIAAKEWMYRFTIRCAKETKSQALQADAWHHRADALSSIGSLVGVVGLSLGYPAVDAAACLAITVFIARAAWDITADAFRRLVDGSTGNEIVDAVREHTLRQPEVEGIDVIKVRPQGSKLYVDMEVTMDASLTLEASHRAASRIHDAVERNVSGVKHCMIHVNPTGLAGHHHI